MGPEKVSSAWVSLLQGWHGRELEMRIARTATALIAAFALGSSSCATLIYGVGPGQVVSMSTNQPGTTVQVDSQKMGSPAQVVLDRYQNHTVVATKPGYEMATTTIDSGYSWATSLDLCLIIPWLIDMVSNSVYTLSPDTVNLVLTPTPMPVYGSTTTNSMP